MYAHGVGPKDPEKFPVSSKRDVYTKELGFLIALELSRLTHSKPHVVVNHLKRSKLDVNREINNGTFGVEEALDAWKAYHAFVEQAKVSIGGPGLLVDVHGHSHVEGWVELGYTLSSQQLNQGSYQSHDTSIHSLATRCGCTSSKHIQVNLELKTTARDLEKLRRRGFFVVWRLLLVRNREAVKTTKNFVTSFQSDVCLIAATDLWGTKPGRVVGE